MWEATGKGADGPREPHQGHKRSIPEEMAAKALARNRGYIPDPKGKNVLTGTWRGKLVCEPSGPEIHLIRKLSGFGTIAIVAKVHRTHSSVKRLVKDKNGKPVLNKSGKRVYRVVMEKKGKAKKATPKRRTTTSVKWSAAYALDKKWDSKSATVKGAFGSLAAAIDKVYGEMSAAIARACKPADIVGCKPPARRKKETKKRQVKSRKTGKVETKPPITKVRKARSAAIKKAPVPRKPRAKGKLTLKIPKSLEKLKGQWALMTAGPLKMRLVKIDGFKPGKSKGSWLVVVRPLVKGKGKARLAKTVKAVPLHYTSKGKKKRTIRIGKTVAKWAAQAIQANAISRTPAGKKTARTGKKVPTAAAKKRAAAKKKADPKKAAPKTGEKKARRRTKPTVAQQKMKGAYVSWGGKTKRYGKVLKVVPGGSEAKPNWATAKLVIKAAHKGGEEITMAEATFRNDNNKGRRSSSDGPYKKALAAWKKAQKANGGGAARTRTTRTKPSGGGLGSMSGPSSARRVAAAAQAADAELAALGL